VAIARLSLHKNPFLGLFFKANEEFLLCPKNAPAKTIDAACEALEVEPVKLFVSQSPLVGVLSAINSFGVVLPDFAEKPERELLKKKGLNVFCLQSFAPGNNVLANDKAALVSPRVPPSDAKKISDCLGVEVFQYCVAGFATVGSLNVVTNKGVFACNEASDAELKELEKTFGAAAGKGTANLGSPCNGLCMAANSKGAVVGELTTGFEIQRIYEALSL